MEKRQRVLDFFEMNLRKIEGDLDQNFHTKIDVIQVDCISRVLEQK